MDLSSLMSGNTQNQPVQNFTPVSINDALSISKGQTLSMNSLMNSLKKVKVGLGWDTAIQTIDLDCEVFGLSNTGKVLNQGWFIFYGQLNSPDYSIVHQGDNRNGSYQGDDETIVVDLTSINKQINKIVFTVTIDEASSRGQHFGMVNNAYIRVLNTENNNEIIRYNLTDNYSGNTAIIVGEFIRQGNDWNFNAIGQGIQGDLYTLCNQYGVNVK